MQRHRQVREPPVSRRRVQDAARRSRPIESRAARARAAAADARTRRDVARGRVDDRARARKSCSTKRCSIASRPRSRRARERGLVAGRADGRRDVLRIPQVLEIRAQRPDGRPADRRARSAELVEAAVGDALDALVVDARRPRAASSRPTSTARLATIAGFVVDARARAARGPAPARGASSASGVAELPPDLQGDPAAVAQESSGSPTGPTSTRRSSGSAAISSTGGRLADGAGAVRPEARLPRAGDEPGDQHDRVEGRRRRGRPKS